MYHQLQQSESLRNELNAAKDELLQTREDAKTAALCSRLRDEHDSVIVRDLKDEITLLKSRTHTLQIQNEGLQHRLDLATINANRVCVFVNFFL